MTDLSHPDWEGLRRAFAAPARAAEAPTTAMGASAPPSAPPIACALVQGKEQAEALRRDLAEERAAVMEYEAGLPRLRAEALAYKAHGLQPP